MFLAANGQVSPAGIQQIAGEIPSREFGAQIAQTPQWLLNTLEHDSLRTVATLRFDGCGNEEIATELDISLRSVARKLQAIRNCWSQLLDGKSVR